MESSKLEQISSETEFTPSACNSLCYNHVSGRCSVFVPISSHGKHYCALYENMPYCDPIEMPGARAYRATPTPYVLGFAKGGCQNHATVKVGEGLVIPGMTPKSCDEYCINEPTKTCTGFVIGRHNEKWAGQCFIFKGDCVKDPGQVSNDYFKSSPREYPSKKHSVCTHNQIHSANRGMRARCSAIST